MNPGEMSTSAFHYARMTGGFPAGVQTDPG